MKGLADFDLEAVYEAEIRPLMDRIRTICRKHELPYLAAFQVWSRGPLDGFVNWAFLPLDRAHGCLLLGLRVLEKGHVHPLQVERAAPN